MPARSIRKKNPMTYTESNPASLYLTIVCEDGSTSPVPIHLFQIKRKLEKLQNAYS